MKDLNRESLTIGKTIGNFESCIIDVGCADTGYVGKHHKKIFNVPCIYIDADQVALEKFIPEPDDLCILAAISSTNGIGKFNLYQEYTHSLLEINLDEIEKYVDGFTGKPSLMKDWKKRDQLLIPKLTLQSIIESLGIKNIKLLKIDTQGHDFEVIKGLGTYITFVESLMCEVQTTDFELYLNQATKDELCNYMQAWNFSLVDSQTQSFGQEENLTFVNNLFKGFGK